MVTDGKDKRQDKNLELKLSAEAEYREMEKAGKKGILGRFNARFNDALQNSRGDETARDAVAESAGPRPVSADDLAMRRARNVSSQKMVIPEGVIIEGSLAGGSETEIGGRIDGNISVEGKLHLSASSLVSGNVRAASCQIDGLVEGKVECSGDLVLGTSGRLNADVLGGRHVRLQGQVFGNITTPGVLTLSPESKVTGDVRVRKLVIEEGAALTGQCIMRTPAQRDGKAKQ